MKFTLVSRPKPDASRDYFDYEWGLIHTGLMATTPSVMKNFQRYIQHRAVDGITNDQVPYPLSTQGWYNMADHWVENLEALTEGIFGGGEYTRRMQPHSFGDKAFVIELTDGVVLFDDPARVNGEGVKLVNFLKRSEGIDAAEFYQKWQGQYAQTLLAQMTGDRPLVRRYVQNKQLPLDPAVFKGTLFEMGGVGTYAGFEELWFDDLESLTAFTQDPEFRGLAALKDEFVDSENSFSLVLVERVVWDFTIPGAPRPAVLDPNSFEAQMIASERAWGEWNTITSPAAVASRP